MLNGAAFHGNQAAGRGGGRWRFLPAGGAVHRRELAARGLARAVDGGRVVSRQEAGHRALASGDGIVARDWSRLLPVLPRHRGHRQEEDEVNRNVWPYAL